MPDASVAGVLHTSDMVYNRENLYFLRFGIPFTVACTYQRHNPAVIVNSVHISNTAQDELFLADFVSNNDECLNEWSGRCDDVAVDVCPNCDNIEYRVMVSGYNASLDGTEFVCGIESSLVAIVVNSTSGMLVPESTYRHACVTRVGILCR